MRRESNFKNDIAIGKIGEEDFEQFLSSSKKCEHFENVTEIPFFQLIDIDYIQFTRLKDDGTQYTSDDVQYAILNHTKKKDMDWCVLYEVKTDTMSSKTRNVVYEIISHDGPGCAAITRSDFVYYVFTDEVNFGKIKERWLIDIRAWRKLIRENCEEEARKQRSEKPSILLNNFDRTNDHVLNFLVNVEYMEKNGVVKKIVEKK